MTRLQEKAYDLARYRAQRSFATWGKDDDLRLFAVYENKSEIECLEAIARFDWEPTQRELDEAAQGIGEMVRG